MPLVVLGLKIFSRSCGETGKRTHPWTSLASAGVDDMSLTLRYLKLIPGLGQPVGLFYMRAFDITVLSVLLATMFGIRTGNFAYHRA